MHKRLGEGVGAGVGRRHEAGRRGVGGEGGLVRGPPEKADKAAAKRASRGQ